MTVTTCFVVAGKIAVAMQLSEFLASDPVELLKKPAISLQELVLETSQAQIGVGVRGGTRQALNLDEVIETIVKSFQRHEYSDICLVIDGLASNKVVNEASFTRLLSAEAEHLIAQSIFKRVESLGV